MNLEHPLKPLFVDRLKITKSKWQQLQALKKCCWEIHTASDQSPSIKNLEVESKNIVKVTEKTKSKKRESNQVNLEVKSKVLRTYNRF